MRTEREVRNSINELLLLEERYKKSCPPFDRYLWEVKAKIRTLRWVLEEEKVDA